MSVRLKESAWVGEIPDGKGNFGDLIKNESEDPCMQFLNEINSCRPRNPVRKHPALENAATSQSQCSNAGKRVHLEELVAKSKEVYKRVFQKSTTPEFEDMPVAQSLQDEIYLLKKAVRERIDFYLDKQEQESRQIWNNFYLNARDSSLTISTPVTDFSELNMHAIKIREQILKRKVATEEAVEINKSYKPETSTTTITRFANKQYQDTNNSSDSLGVSVPTSRKFGPNSSKMESMSNSTSDPFIIFESIASSKPKRASKPTIRFTEERFERAKRKPLEQQPTQVTTTIKELVRNDNEFAFSLSGEAICIKNLKSQYHVPLLNSYLSTPFNIRMPDATELQNCPYLGDDLDEKQKKFLEDLIYNFEGKLRAWVHIEDIPQPLFVEVVHLIWKSCGVNLNDPAIDLRDPPEDVIYRLGELFNNDDHIKLRERYINFTSDKEVVKSLRDVSDPETIFSREKAVETLVKFFCRRCYIYDCEMHDAVSFPKADKYVSDIPHNQLPCNNTCYMENFPCLYFCNCVPCASIQNSLLMEWSNSELTVLNLLAPGHGRDVCNLASCFPLKNCKQVFLKLLQVGCVSQMLQEESLQQEGMREFAHSFDDLKLLPELLDPSIVRYEYEPGVFFVKRHEIDLVNKVLSKQQSLHKHPYYQPCYHESSDALCGVGSEKCECVSKDSFCDKSCGCSLDCPNRFPGCRCTRLGCQLKKSCLCLLASRECDPDLCVNCCALTEMPFADLTEAPLSHQLPDVAEVPQEVTPEIVNEYVKQSGFHHCKNFGLQTRHRNSKIMLGVSEVAGWGLFATMPIRAGEFIGEYRGEVVSHNEAERRGQMYDRNFNSYLFALNSEFVVDATVKGCKMRFINHADKPNCSAKVMHVCGDHKIGIYASKNIKAGHELFYNYRYSGRHRQNKEDDVGFSSTEEESSQDYEEEAPDEEDKLVPVKKWTATVKFCIASD